MTFTKCESVLSAYYHNRHSAQENVLCQGWLESLYDNYDNQYLLWTDNRLLLNIHTNNITCISLLVQDFLKTSSVNLFIQNLLILYARLEITWFKAFSLKVLLWEPALVWSPGDGGIFEMKTSLGALSKTFVGIELDPPVTLGSVTLVRIKSARITAIWIGDRYMRQMKLFLSMTKNIISN